MTDTSSDDTERLPCSTKISSGADLAPSGLGSGPLAGLRVLELGHFIAGPFCTRLLADLGATVIKVEAPGEGDPIRNWGERIDGKSVWWSVHGRNKKCITLDLKRPEGRDIALKLAAQSSIVVENFRPGQLERWELGPTALAQVNPSCVLVRISGYGQTGPARDTPAFGVIAEARGGLRYLTNWPESDGASPPIRTGVSLGDSVAGMYGAMAALAALHEQSKSVTPKLLTVDVALTEAVFSLLEGCLPEYGLMGKVRQPTGSTLPTNAPSNAYPSAGRSWVLIAANSDRLFSKLSDLMGRPDLPADPRFSDNAARVQNAELLDSMIGSWTRRYPAENIVTMVEEIGIPITRVYTIEDCVNDPQMHERGMIQEVNDPVFGKVLHPAAVPLISGHDRADAIRWTGPSIGEHTDEILRDVVKIAPTAITKLREDGVI